MDPISLAQIVSSAFGVAQGAFQIGKVLYDFYHDVKNLDNTAREFASEIDALGSACELVGTRVRSIVQEHEKDKHGENDYLTQSAPLWSCLARQIAACQTTLKDLSEAVSCVSKTQARNPGFMRQAWSQIRLYMKAGDIEDVRNRIKTHTSSLQLTLQSVAIEVAYVIPNRVDQQLRQRLSELTSQQLQLQSLQAQRNETHEVVQDKDEAYLLAISEKIKVSGETLYNESQAGGSVIGELLPGKSDFITRWINDANAIEQVVSEASTEMTDTPSVFSNTRLNRQAYTEDSTSIDASTHVDSVNACGEDSDDLGSDEDIAIEAAELTITQGRTAFQKQEYAEAASILKEALSWVRELSSKRQTICNIGDVRFMLGVCAFHLEEPAVAKEALLSVVNSVHESRNQDNARSASLLQAGHLLAQTHIRLGEIEQAREVCDSTINGRRRILGKAHESYHESLALRARIFEIQGYPRRAHTYASLLPDESRESLTNAFRELSVFDKTASKIVSDATPSTQSSSLSGPTLINSTAKRSEVEDFGGTNKQKPMLTNNYQSKTGFGVGKAPPPKETPVTAVVSSLDSRTWYSISNPAKPGMALDVVNDGNQLRDGNLQMAQEGNFSGQRWQFRPSTIYPGMYNLCTMWLGSGMSLDVYGNDKTRPHLAKTGAYSGQQWRVVKQNDTTWKLTNTYSGTLVLAAKANGNQICMVDPRTSPASQWVIQAIKPITTSELEV